MSLQRAKLADTAYVASTITSVYANPSATKTFIRGLMLHNTNTLAETVEVYNVPDNAGALGTASGSNKILNCSLPANDTLIVEMPYSVVLTDTNDSLQAKTTTASKVTITLFGDKDA